MSTTGVTRISPEEWEREMAYKAAMEATGPAAELRAIADEIAFDAGSWMSPQERNDTMTDYAARIRAVANRLGS